MICRVESSPSTRSTLTGILGKNFSHLTSSRPFSSFISSSSSQSPLSTTRCASATFRLSSPALLAPTKHPSFLTLYLNDAFFFALECGKRHRSSPLLRLYLNPRENISLAVASRPFDQVEATSSCPRPRVHSIPRGLGLHCDAWSTRWDISPAHLVAVVTTRVANLFGRKEIFREGDARSILVGGAAGDFVVVDRPNPGAQIAAAVDHYHRSKIYRTGAAVAVGRNQGPASRV